ncbi:hypothetical protein GCM10027048_15400 [Hymenobacter coalescens]
MQTPELRFYYPNRFDRLLFDVPAHYVEQLQPSLFIEKATADGFVFYELRDYSSVFGLTLIKWEPSKNRYWIEIGAKLLGQRYPELLHRGNIYDALELLNRAMIIHVDPRALRYARLSSLAVTEDKRIEAPNDEFQKTLVLQAVPSGRYKLEPFKKGDALKTIHFVRQVSTKQRKHLLKIYDKAHEFRLPRNASFRDSLPNAGTVAAQFEHMQRFELEAKSEHKIREFFKLPTHTYPPGEKRKPRRPYLLEVLESPETPLLNIWKEITDEMQQLLPIAATDLNTEAIPNANAFGLFLLQLDPKQQKDFALMMAMHMDMNKLESFTKYSYSRPQTVSERMKNYRKLYRQWQSQSNDMLQRTLGLVTRVTHQLAAPRNPGA